MSSDQNEKDLLAAIQRIQEWKGGKIHYESVIGGVTNPNWKVTQDGRTYFVKIPGRGIGDFIDRNTAHIANLIAEREDIGPKVCYYFEDSGVEVFEWLESYRTLTFGDVYNRALFCRMIEVIRKFHQHREIRLPVTQTPFEQTYQFMQLAMDLKGYLPPEIDRMDWLAHKIEEAVMVTGIEFVPCHNDFWTANFLYNERTADLRLTDFEYAANCDACWDFADIATANYFTEAMDVEWIRLYYGGFQEEKFARLKLYKILKDIAWAMWSLFQAQQSSVQGFDYYNWFGTKMARLRQNWNDPRLDYWLNLVKGAAVF